MRDKIVYIFYGAIACAVVIWGVINVINTEITTEANTEIVTETPEIVQERIFIPTPKVKAKGVVTIAKPTEVVNPEPVKVVDTPEITTEVVTPEPKHVSLGEFTLTAYCSCSICCGKYAENRPLDEDGCEIVCGASGERLFTDYSCAVDPTVIPLGTEIIYNGHTYKAVDTGSGVKGKWIDFYVGNHDQAKAFGTQKGEIFLK